jgi:hypothetical protein
MGIHKKSLGGLLRASQGFIDCMRVDYFAMGSLLMSFCLRSFCELLGIVNEEI